MPFISSLCSCQRDEFQIALFGSFQMPDAVLILSRHKSPWEVERVGQKLKGMIDKDLKIHLSTKPGRDQLRFSVKGQIRKFCLCGPEQSVSWLSSPSVTQKHHRQQTNTYCLSHKTLFTNTGILTLCNFHKKYSVTNFPTIWKHKIL